jgi:hypothetical protein
MIAQSQRPGGHPTTYKFRRQPHVNFRFHPSFRSHQGEREKNEYLIDAETRAKIAREL